MFVPAVPPDVVVPFAVQNSNTSVVIVLLALAAMIFLIFRSFFPKKQNQKQDTVTPVSKPDLPLQRSKAPAKQTRTPIQPKTTIVRTLKGKAYVIDGDTIVVSKTKIRLAGIDAPEPDQPWGRKSKSAMIQICKGSILTVHLNGEQTYDREVGTVYLPDGRDVGAELIKQGLALDLEKFSGGKYRHLEPEGVRRKILIWRSINYRKSLQP